MPKLNLLKQINNRTGTQDNRLNVKEILIGEINISKNVRENNNIEIDDLKSSIRQVGLLQPITVYKSNEQYICLIGHRRLMAYKSLYTENRDLYHSIRCIITDNENITKKQLIENVQRENLKPMELCNALKELKDEGLTLKQIGNIIGKKESTIKKWFTAINNLEKNIEIKEIANSYSRVTLDDIQETTTIKNKEKRIKLLKEKGQGIINRKELREKIKPVNFKSTVSNQVEITLDRKNKSIHLFFNDKNTYKLIVGELKVLLNKHNIKITKREN